MIERCKRHLTSNTVFTDRSLHRVRWKEKGKVLTLSLDKDELTFKSTGNSKWQILHHSYLTLDLVLYLNLNMDMFYQLTAFTTEPHDCI